MNPKFSNERQKKRRKFETAVAAAGVTWPEAAGAKECKEPPEAGRGKKAFSPQALGGNRASRTVRKGGLLL